MLDYCNIFIKNYARMAEEHTAPRPPVLLGFLIPANFRRECWLQEKIDIISSPPLRYASLAANNIGHYNTNGQLPDF